MFIARILIAIERMLGFDAPVPVDGAKRLRDQKKIVKRIVTDVSRGNLSLQDTLNGSQYIMSEDVELLRNRNQKHDFCS